MVKRGMAWEMTQDREEAKLRVVYNGKEIEWGRQTGRIELPGLNNEIYYTGWSQDRGRMESSVRALF